MSELFAHAPEGELLYTFDWSADLPDGVSINEVSYTIPSPLEQFVDSQDLGNKRSTLGVRGVTHGSMHHVLALATMSTGEKVPKTLIVRGFASA